MMSLEIEMMAMQRNVGSSHSEVFLKTGLFKEIEIMKTTYVYIHFKKKLQVKSLQLSQK